MRNSFLRGCRAVGLDDRILSIGDNIRIINGEESHTDMKHHLLKASHLHMMINRERSDEVQTVLGATVVGGATDPTIAYPAGLGKCLGKWVNFCLPPEAIPLRRGLILPPPRTSILGIGPWPPSAQAIYDLFILPTNVN